MPQGKVKWFNNAKGYGFIIADDSDQDQLANEDLFAHFSSIQMEGYKTLKAGQAVSFDAQPSGKGFHAVNIVPLDAPKQDYKGMAEQVETKPEVENRKEAPVTA